MTIDQITTLVAAGESETLEFKHTTGARREAAKTVCAMLNHRGGHVLFGVTPEGKVEGQQVGKRTIEDLSEELRRIEPQELPVIERIRVNGDREVLAVEVGRGPSRPYMYRGKAYRRVGNTTVAMSSHEYRRMLMEQMHGEMRWETQPAEGWSVEHLDVAQIRRVVAEAVRREHLDEPLTRDPIDLLRGLGLLQEGVLLRAAVVLFGKRERLMSRLPQCKLRVARFRGVDKMDFLDNRQFNGNAFSLLASAERFLRDSLPVAARFESDRIERIDEPLYPQPATREALANAICHRDYSIHGGSIGVAIYADRLEITSAGPLPFDLTPERLFVSHPSRPWNPLIAQTFHRCGIIEEWGTGTLKMMDWVDSAGLPPLEIEDVNDSVTVRFRHGQFVPEQYRYGRPADRKAAILSLLYHSEDGLSRREINTHLTAVVSERQLRRTLEELKGEGLVISTNQGKLTRWKLSKGARRERERGAKGARKGFKGVDRGLIPIVAIQRNIAVIQYSERIDSNSPA